MKSCLSTGQVAKFWYPVVMEADTHCCFAGSSAVEAVDEEDSEKVIVNPSAANEFSMDATASAILSVLDGIFIHYRNKVLKVSLIEIGFCFTPKLAVLRVQLNTNRKLEVVFSEMNMCHTSNRMGTG